MYKIINYRIISYCKAIIMITVNLIMKSHESMHKVYNNAIIAIILYCL